MPKQADVEVDEQAKRALAGFQIGKDLCQMQWKQLLASLQLDDEAIHYQKVEPCFPDRHVFYGSS